MSHPVSSYFVTRRFAGFSTFANNIAHICLREQVIETAGVQTLGFRDRLESLA
jgi:hypothetical protein